MHERQFLHLLSLPLINDNKIQRYKRACQKHIGVFPSMSARAHISLSNVRDIVDEYTGIPQILNSYHQTYTKIFQWVPPPTICLNGFDFFMHGSNYRTIYAKIVMTGEIGYWFNYVKPIFLLNNNFNPHVTIARNITTEAFNKLWPYFSQLDFTDTFKIDSLTVLAKDVDKKHATYQTYKEIPFGGVWHADS